jgi:hypothetical protein
MDIHSISQVNMPDVDLSAIDGPPTSDVYNEDARKMGQWKKQHALGTDSTPGEENTGSAGTEQ